MSGLFPLPLSSEDFRICSEVFGHIWESLVVLVFSSKSWHSQDKNLTPITQKKLAGNGWRKAKGLHDNIVVRGKIYMYM